MRYLLPVALMALIFVSSHQPTPISLPSRSDLLIHAIVFGALALSWHFALAGSGLAPATSGTLGFSIATMWGVLDEYHQSFIPGRSAEIADALADAAGAGISLLAIWIVTRRKMPRAAAAEGRPAGPE